MEIFTKDFAMLGSGMAKVNILGEMAAYTRVIGRMAISTVMAYILIQMVQRSKALGLMEVSMVEISS
jgi:hypothetical protein